MSVSFLLERDTAMYGNPARHLNLAQSHLNVYPNAPYPDYSGYPPVSALGNDLHHTGSAWSAGFGLREDWPQLYGHGTGHGVDVNVIPPVEPGLLSGGPSAPAEREEAQDWMRRALANTGEKPRALKKTSRHQRHNSQIEHETIPWCGAAFTTIEPRFHVCGRAPCNTTFYGYYHSVI